MISSGNNQIKGKSQDRRDTQPKHKFKKIN